MLIVFAITKSNTMALKDCARIMVPNVSRYAFTGCAADPRADFLDDGHKGIGEQQSPRNCEAELCSCLRICRNTAGIIVCGTGDKTWSKRTKNAAVL